MVTDDGRTVQSAGVEAFERGLLAKRELDAKNAELDIAVVRLARELNLQFASWLVQKAESQQRSPREILNDIFLLTLQTKRE